jgi:hypothetical protein
MGVLRRLAYAPFVACLCLLLTATARAQTFIGYESVRKSVVFLYASDASGKPDESRPLGTGFLIGIPAKSLSGKSYLLLVTARHIVDPAWMGCPLPNPSRIFLRFNKKKFDPAFEDSGVEYQPLDLIWAGPDKSVFVNSDPRVDAAVTLLPLVLSGGDYDIDSISTDLFATPEESRQLGEGIEIVSAGLLPAVAGVRRNYPVFKFGRISSKPDEETKVGCIPGAPTRSLKLWLIAINLVGGNSGSPILSMPRLFSPDRAALLGVQSSSFLGSDIAGMTPIHYVYEILQSIGKGDWDLHEGLPGRR